MPRKYWTTPETLLFGAALAEPDITAEALVKRFARSASSLYMRLKTYTGDPPLPRVPRVMVELSRLAQLDSKRAKKNHLGAKDRAALNDLWLTVLQASVLVGRTTKSIHEWSRNKRLRSVQLPRPLPRGAPHRLVNALDVLRLSKKPLEALRDIPLLDRTGAPAPHPLAALAALKEARQVLKEEAPKPAPSKKAPVEPEPTRAERTLDTGEVLALIKTEAKALRTLVEGGIVPLTPEAHLAALYKIVLDPR